MKTFLCLVLLAVCGCTSEMQMKLEMLQTKVDILEGRVAAIESATPILAPKKEIAK